MEDSVQKAAGSVDPANAIGMPAWSVTITYCSGFPTELATALLAASTNSSVLPGPAAGGAATETRLPTAIAGTAGDATRESGGRQHT